VTARVDYGPLYAQATYAYTAVNPEFTDEGSQQDVIGAVGLQLTDRWSLFGAMRYDIDDSQRLTDSVQLKYLDECFMLSATYSETFIEDVDRDIEPDRTVMLRFELKHLGGFNYATNVTDFVSGEGLPDNQ
jgi:LPS-assembly protein